MTHLPGRRVATPRPHPINRPHLVAGAAVNGERSESAGREAPLTAETETKHSQPGEAETPTIDRRKPVSPTQKDDDHGKVVAKS